MLSRLDSTKTRINAHVSPLLQAKTRERILFGPQTTQYVISGTSKIALNQEMYISVIHVCTGHFNTTAKLVLSIVGIVIIIVVTLIAFGCFFSTVSVVFVVFC